jgi:hypothetical protein
MSCTDDVIFTSLHFTSLHFHSLHLKRMIFQTLGSNAGKPYNFSWHECKQGISNNHSSQHTGQSTQFHRSCERGNKSKCWNSDMFLFQSDCMISNVIPRIHVNYGELDSPQRWRCLHCKGWQRSPTLASISPSLSLLVVTILWHDEHGSSIYRVHETRRTLCGPDLVLRFRKNWWHVRKLPVDYGGKSVCPGMSTNGWQTLKRLRTKGVLMIKLMLGAHWK